MRCRLMLLALELVIAVPVATTEPALGRGAVAGPARIMRPAVRAAQAQQAAQPSSQVAAVEVRTTLASLSEQRPGRLYLLVRSTSDVPVHVERVVVMGPEFIALEPQRKLPLSVPAGETAIIPYAVTAGASLQPGKQLLVFDVRLRWARGARAFAGNLIAAQEVSVEVFGESALLGIIAVPALLLLPGALIVLTFCLGLMWLWKRSDLPMKPTSPFFWVIAVPLSFLVAFLYPLLPGGQNYLLAYGFRDVVLVWLQGSGVLAICPIVR